MELLPCTSAGADVAGFNSSSTLEELSHAYKEVFLLPYSDFLISTLFNKSVIQTKTTTKTFPNLPRLQVFQLTQCNSNPSSLSSPSPSRHLLPPPLRPFPTLPQHQHATTTRLWHAVTPFKAARAWDASFQVRSLNGTGARRELQLTIFSSFERPQPYLRGLAVVGLLQLQPGESPSLINIPVLGC